MSEFVKEPWLCTSIALGKVLNYFAVSLLCFSHTVRDASANSNEHAAKTTDRRDSRVPKVELEEIATRKKKTRE